jgi:hypothetical protein
VKFDVLTPFQKINKKVTTRVRRALLKQQKNHTKIGQSRPFPPGMFTWSTGPQLTKNPSENHYGRSITMEELNQKT